MENIKYILWDVDRTLIDFNLAEATSLKATFERYGFGEFDDDLLAEYKVINDRYWKQIEQGTIDKKEALVMRFVEFFNNHNLDTSVAAQFNHEYMSGMAEIAVFMPNAKEAVEYLKGKYKQYAASNGTVGAQNTKLRKSGLIDILDGVFISEEVGVEKPSKEYFDYIFNVVGSNNPEEYLIIGDSLSSDIKGGENAGIKTCWYNYNNKVNNTDVVPDYEINNLKEVMNLL